MATGAQPINNPTGTGANARYASNAGVDGGAEQQIVTLADAVGNLVGADTAGRLQVNISGSGGLNTPQAGNLTAAAGTAITGVAGATTSRIVIDVSQAGNASFALLATAFVGTVIFEQSFDAAGTAGTWASVPCVPEDAAGVPLSTVAINGAYLRQFTQTMFGPKLFSIRCSVFTSGSLAVVLSAGPGWYESQPALAPSEANVGAHAPHRSVPVRTASAAPVASATLLAANAIRSKVKVDATLSNVDVLLGEDGNAVTATSWTQRIPAGSFWESDASAVSTAAITWAGFRGSALTAGTGNVMVTEY